MKLIYRSLIFIGADILLFFLLPFIILNTAHGDSGMALAFILFFAVYPLGGAVTGYLCADDPKRLFWTPFLYALLFPFCFSLALGEMVWDLFIYSPVYFALGAIALGITHLIKTISLKTKRGKENE